MSPRRWLGCCAITLALAACGTTRPPPSPPARKQPARAARPVSPPPLPGEQDVPDVELPGELYAVKPGDTLWSIARAAGSSVDELSEVNGLRDTDTLSVGQSLFIPAPDPMAPPPPPGPALEQEAFPPDVPPLTPTGDPPPFVWPIKDGVLFSEFGPRQGSHHDGMDLGAPEGTPVLAAGDGDVVYAGQDNGAYGLLVIVKHAEERVTIYAHNQQNLVAEGQRVKQGQVIARVGATGAAQTPHVHFEVRVKRRPVDPVPLLPVE